MARYATQERQYYCDDCEQWITEREMVELDEVSDTPGGYCPGCKTTMWMRIIVWDGESDTDDYIVAEVVDHGATAERFLLEEDESGRMVKITS